MWLDWKIIAPLVLIILGWFVANWLTARRDLRNKKREIRVQYLIEAYRSIASAAHRGEKTSEKQKRAIESAVEDIQLLGTLDQVAALNRMIESHKGDFTEVLESVRNELRNELSLKKNRGFSKVL